MATKWIQSTNVQPVNLDIRDSRSTNTAVMVMVKLTVNRQEEIPAGIPEQERGYDADADARNTMLAALAGEVESLKLGAVRKGRNDTGKQLIGVNGRDGKALSCHSLTRALASNGFGLRKAYWYEKPAEGQRKSPNWTVVLEFMRIGNAPELADKTTREIRALLARTWGSVFVWDNPPHAADEDNPAAGLLKTVTVNIGWPLPKGTKPMASVTIRHRELGLIRVEEEASTEEAVAAAVEA